MKTASEKVKEDTGMADESFMAVVRHRAALLSVSLSPGPALVWCREGDNVGQLLRLQEMTRPFMAGHFSEDDTSTFWRVLSGIPAMSGFLHGQGPEVQWLCRRGRLGDRYSVPVLHVVIQRFITDYIRQERPVYRRTATAVMNTSL
ncbi:hypothetical protein ILU99_002960 [Salmonella enterica]|nr:hypothetical protein [Salmonella enterica]EED7478894.1 hypothetical protein [Salmonella enterica subsp. enterica]EHG5810743.1 hypothetical protein [Salmonella enterica subsp. enterica serovar Nottingham]EHJ5010087.1 hypothetical protein [Salmonella enterica subsp. enterica serovar Saintpaul]EDQ5137272.1 hypothetical protein [Salmonella enterica]